jgi:DNA repair exonuclease SbcCD ATPase subunit
MVNEEVVLNTIKKMQEAGLSNPIIESTLTDLGLNQNQVRAFLARAKGEDVEIPSSAKVKVEEPVEPAPKKPFLSEEDRDAIASKTTEKIQQTMTEREASIQDHHSLKDSITHLALEQHGQQLKETHENVMSLHDKLDATNFQAVNSRLTSLNTKIEKLSADVKDTKALSKALQTLLQKILEANQQILFEFQGKKSK